jgi:predicted ABC-type ATPase
MGDSARLLIVGGPNGSGKTTLAIEYAAELGFPYVGADAIAETLDPEDPSRVRIAASRQFIQTVDGHISNQQSLVVESTLSGLTIRQVIGRAQAIGFDVSIAFLFVDSADVCVGRVTERVRKGGHDVLEVAIRRRFGRSVSNFWRIYRELADHWVLLYNGESKVSDIAAGSGDKFTIRDASLYTAFISLVEDS